MGNRFSSGKNSISQCDRCNFRFKLHELRTEVIKTKPYQIKVCRTCWDPDHPQLQLGMYPVDDPQGVRDPRPDITYLLGGNTGLQITDTPGPGLDASGTPSGGSRIIQWGWNPVGGSTFFTSTETPNNLVSRVELGTVTVELDTMPGAMLGGVSTTTQIGKILGPLPITGVQATGQTGDVSPPAIPASGVSSGASVGAVERHKNLVFPAAGVDFQFSSTVDPGFYTLTIAYSNPTQGAIAQAMAAAFYGGDYVQMYIDASPTYPPATTPPFFAHGFIYDANAYFGYSQFGLYLPGTPAPANGTYYVNSAFKTVYEFTIPVEYGTPAYAQVGPNSSLTYTGNVALTLNSTYAGCPVLPVGTNVWANVSSPPYLVNLGTLTSIVYDAGAQTFTINMVTVTPKGAGVFTQPLRFVPNTINI